MHLQTKRKMTLTLRLEMVQDLLLSGQEKANYIYVNRWKGKVS